MRFLPLLIHDFNPSELIFNMRKYFRMVSILWLNCFLYYGKIGTFVILYFWHYFIMINSFGTVITVVQKETRRPTNLQKITKQNCFTLWNKLYCFTSILAKMQRKNCWLKNTTNYCYKRKRITEKKKELLIKK